MEDFSSLKSVGNIALILMSILSFILGFLPGISPEFRNILLYISPIILVIGIFFIYLGKQEIISKRILHLEEKVKRAEDLINIKADIEYLKRQAK